MNTIKKRQWEIELYISPRDDQIDMYFFAKCEHESGENEWNILRFLLNMFMVRIEP